MSELALRNRQRVRRINARHLKQIGKLLLTGRLGVEKYELCLHLVGEREMTRLNETFLRHEGPTDVITFDYATPGPPTPDHRHRTTDPGPRLHGEIFVCVDEVVRQARRFRTTWQSEIIRCTLHGLLHLLGYDDSTPAMRRTMKREENRGMKWLARAAIEPALRRDRVR